MYYTRTVMEFIVNLLFVQIKVMSKIVVSSQQPLQLRFQMESHQQRPILDVERMRGHLINCLENKVPIPFLKVESHLSVKGVAIKKYSIRQVLFYKCSVLNKIQAVLHLWSQNYKKYVMRFLLAKLETSNKQLYSEINFCNCKAAFLGNLPRWLLLWQVPYEYCKG